MPQVNKQGLFYVLFLLIAASAVFWKFFLLPDHILDSEDLHRAHAEYKWTQWRSFHEYGTFPLWDPTVYCGKSIVGDSLPGVLYPPGSIFWLSASPRLFGWFLWVHICWAALGMYVLARRRGCSEAGAAMAGIAFALSGKMAAHFFAGHMEVLLTVAWLPWLMWALDRVLHRHDWRDAALLGGMAAVAATCGSLQFFYWHMLFMAVCVLAWMTEAAIRGEAAAIPGATGRLAGAAGAFALFGAPYWLPVVRQTLLFSARARQADPQFPFMANPVWSDLLRFVWPLYNSPEPKPFFYTEAHDVFWEKAAYFGLIPLFLAICALVFLRKRPGVLATAILMLASVVFALGQCTPLYGLACNIIPAFGLFRCPGRLFFYTSFLGALLAGWMLTDLGALRRQRMAPAYLAALLFTATAGGAAALAVMKTGPALLLWTAPLFAAATVALMMLSLVGRLPQPMLERAAVALACVDLFLVWQPHVQVLKPEAVMPVREGMKWLSKARANSMFRVHDPTATINQAAAARFGLEIIEGYHPGVNARHLELYKRIWNDDQSTSTDQKTHPGYEAANPVILDLMNAEYSAWFERKPPADSELALYVPSDGFKMPFFLYKRHTALPRAWLVGRASVPAPGVAPLDALCAINPRETCLAEDQPFEGGAAYQAITYERRSPHECLLRFSADKPGMAVLSQTWHPDWVAEEAGQKLEMRRVNYNFTGIPVAAGDHVIRVWYRPWDFYLGLGLCGFAFVIVAGALAAPSLGRRPPQKPAPRKRKPAAKKTPASSM